MVDYNILTQDTPVGGTAVADILILTNGSASDATTVRAVWKDHLGTTISDQTYSGSDISTTGIHGEAVTLTNPAGTGTYKATMVIHTGTYEVGTFPKAFTLRLVVTTPNGNDDDTFAFDVIASSVTTSLDSSAVITFVKRKAGLLKDVTFLASSAAPPALANGRFVLSLGHDMAYAIDAAFKNGTAIVLTTDYEWKEGRPNITLAAQPAENDFYLFRIQTRLTDTAIQDYITEATRYVLAKLQPFYADTSLATYPTVSQLVGDLTVGRIKQDISEGVALESAHYRSGFDLAKSVEGMIAMIQRGTADVIDNNGTAVGRVAGSLAGGFVGSSKIEDRKDLRTLTTKWDRFYLSFYPMSNSTKESR